MDTGRMEAFSDGVLAIEQLQQSSDSHHQNQGQHVARFFPAKTSSFVGQLRAVSERKPLERFPMESLNSVIFSDLLRAGS